MTEAIESLVLDSGILGLVSHPRPNPEFADWFDEVLTTETLIAIPEIADYEVRRELLRVDKKASIKRLDRLKSIFAFLPLDSKIMLHAAELWAQARRRGRPTADPKELDCDVILASQAIETGAHVVTENVGHLALFVSASSWRDLVIEKTGKKRRLILSQ